jgi:Protein of unknown function, DUF481
VRNRGNLFVVVMGAMIVTALAPSTARGQDPFAPTPPVAPPPPAAKGFSGTATVGISLQSGRTDLNATQLSMQGRRPYSGAGVFTMSATYTRATTRPPGAPALVTVADRLEGNFGIEHNYGRRLVLMVRAQGLRDSIERIDYEVEQITGLGVRFGNERVQVRVVPGLALLDHDKNIQTENGFNTNWGVYQDVKATLAPGWALTEFVSTSRDVKDENDYVVAVDLRLTGAITKRLGVQLAYQYSFERLLPPGVEPVYQRIMTGLQISF